MIEPDEALTVELEGAFDRVLASSRKQVLAELRSTATVLVAASGDPGNVPHPAGLFDVELWRAAVDVEVGPILAKVLIDAANRAGLGYSFDLTDPRMAAAVSRHVLGIEAWGQEFRATIAKTVERGMTEGWSIDTMAVELAENGSLTTARAVGIARTEAIAAANAGTIEGWRTLGFIARKKWSSTDDDRTRDTHVDVDGQEVGLDEKFTVGGASADYPGDPSLPLKERINCRCGMFSVEGPEPLPDVTTLAAAAGREALYRAFKNDEHDHRGRFAPKGTGVTPEIVDRIAAWEVGDDHFDDEGIPEAMSKGARAWISGPTEFQPMRAKAAEITGIRSTDPVARSATGAREAEVRSLLDGIANAPAVTVVRGLRLSGADAEELIAGGKIADALATTTTNEDLALRFAGGLHGGPGFKGADGVGVVITYRDTKALPITPFHIAACERNGVAPRPLLATADEHLISGRFDLDPSSVRRENVGYLNGGDMIYVDAYPAPVTASAAITTDGYFIPPDGADGGSITGALAGEPDDRAAQAASLYETFEVRHSKRDGRFLPKGASDGEAVVASIDALPALPEVELFDGLPIDDGPLRDAVDKNRAALAATPSGADVVAVVSKFTDTRDVATLNGLRADVAAGKHPGLAATLAAAPVTTTDLYRGMGWNGAPADLRVGDVVPVDGWSSFTSSSEHAQNFLGLMNTGGIIMKLPPGKGRAVDVSKLSNSPTEAESWVPRPLRITAVTQNGNRTEVVCETI